MPDASLIETLTAEKPTHTPGPWKVNGQAGYAGHTVIDTNGRSVAAFPSSSKRPKSERDANARLIASAPELLAALKDLEAFADHVFDNDEWAKGHGVMVKARAAIAKAEAGR